MVAKTKRRGKSIYKIFYKRYNDALRSGATGLKTYQKATSQDGSITLLIDSVGLKIAGGGE